MIIGKGLIANAFTGFKENEKVIIFASGVSNSGEIYKEAYRRENSLLQSISPGNSKLIYFSTVSVFDPGLGGNEYIKHKLLVEQFIPANFSSWIIFRLPNVVGRSGNLFTLTNYLCNRIVAGEEVVIYKNACRYLIDIDDVAALLSPAISSSVFDNQVVNVHLGNSIAMPELVAIFEDVINKGADKKIVDKGSCYEVENTTFKKYLRSVNYDAGADYNAKLIRKYYNR